MATQLPKGPRAQILPAERKRSNLSRVYAGALPTPAGHPGVRISTRAESLEKCAYDGVPEGVASHLVSLKESMDVIPDTYRPRANKAWSVLYGSFAHRGLGGEDGGCVELALKRLGITLPGLPQYHTLEDVAQLSEKLRCIVSLRLDDHSLVESFGSIYAGADEISLFVDPLLTHCHLATIEPGTTTEPLFFCSRSGPEAATPYVDVTLPNKPGNLSFALRMRDCLTNDSNASHVKFLANGDISFRAHSLIGCMPSLLSRIYLAAARACHVDFSVSLNRLKFRARLGQPGHHLGLASNCSREYHGHDGPFDITMCYLGKSTDDDGWFDPPEGFCVRNTLRCKLSINLPELSPYIDQHQMMSIARQLETRIEVRRAGSLDEPSWTFVPEICGTSAIRMISTDDDKHIFQAFMAMPSREEYFADGPCPFTVRKELVRPGSYIVSIPIGPNSVYHVAKLRALLSSHYQTSMIHLSSQSTGVWFRFRSEHSERKTMKDFYSSVAEIYMHCDIFPDLYPGEISHQQLSVGINRPKSGESADPMWAGDSNQPRRVEPRVARRQSSADQRPNRRRDERAVIRTMLKSDEYEPKPLASQRGEVSQALTLLSGAVKKGDFAKLKQDVDRIKSHVENDKAGPFASNFGAAKNFGMAAAFGATVSPNLDEGTFASMLKSVLDGSSHPPRWGLGTHVFEVQASKMMTLSSLTTGYDVIVVTPVNAAHKGSVILQRSNATWSVLGYVAPDLDVESICDRSAVLFTKLDITSSQLAGGNTVVASNAIVESGVLPICPLAVQTGKMVSIAGATNALLPKTLSGGGADLAEFTFDYPDQSILRANQSDVLDANLCLTASTEALSVPTMGNSYDISSGLTCSFSGANGTTLGAGAGWSPTVLPVSTTLITTGTQSTVVWQFNKTHEYLKHLYFGRVAAEFNFPLTITAAAAGNTFLKANFTMTFSDASTLTRTFAIDMPVIAGSTSFPLAGMFDGAGNSEDATKAGLFITNCHFSISNTPAGGADTLKWSAFAPHGYVRLRFLDVMPDTKYLCHTIAGLTSSHTISVTSRTSVEAWVKKGTQMANLVTIDNVFPYNKLDAAQMYSIARTAGPVAEASAFTRWVKKAAKGVNKYVLQPAVGVAKAGLKLASGAMIPGLPSATSFGEGESMDNQRIRFPAVYPDGSVVCGEVVPGFGHCPDFVSSVTDADLRSFGIGPYLGNSDNLAFLVAALRKEGWPMQSGVFSGEVLDLTYDGQQLDFTLAQIDSSEIKSSEVHDPHECICGPDGIRTADGSASRPIKRGDLFRGPMVFSAQKVRVRDYPGFGYRISACRKLE